MIEPHGGLLVNRIVPQEDREEFLEDLQKTKKYYISEGDVSIFHRMADGILSPLEGPMVGEEFYKVLEEEHIVRNVEKLAWTIPIAFPAKEDYAKSYKVGEKVAVISPSGEIVGSILREDIYPFEKRKYLKSVYGTERVDHPGAPLPKVDGRTWW